jgi:hypothetical protein
LIGKKEEGKKRRGFGKKLCNGNHVFEKSENKKTKITLRIFFRIINDFVHRFILDRTFVDFTVSLFILPSDSIDFYKIPQFYQNLIIYFFS